MLSRDDRGSRWFVPGTTGVLFLLVVGINADLAIPSTPCQWLSASGVAVGRHNAKPAAGVDSREQALLESEREGGANPVQFSRADPVHFSVALKASGSGQCSEDATAMLAVRGGRESWCLRTSRM